MIRATALSKRMRLESPGSGERNATGEVVPMWAKVADVWAELKPGSANQRNLAGTTALETAYTITMRYRADVLTGWRLVYGDRVFHISQREDVEEKHEELRLTVIERTAT